MKSPYTQEEMILVYELRTFTKNGITFDVTLTYWRCPDTYLTFEDEELSENNYNNMMLEYKKYI